MAEEKALTINGKSSSEIGSPTTAPQPIVGDEMSSEREREREFSKSSHLVWRMVEQNENGLSKRVSKDFI